MSNLPLSCTQLQYLKWSQPCQAAIGLGFLVTMWNRVPVFVHVLTIYNFVVRLSSYWIVRRFPRLNDLYLCADGLIAATQSLYIALYAARHATGT